MRRGGHGGLCNEVWVDAYCAAGSAGGAARVRTPLRACRQRGEGYRCREAGSPVRTGSASPRGWPRDSDTRRSPGVWNVPPRPSCGRSPATADPTTTGRNGPRRPHGIARADPGGHSPRHGRPRTAITGATLRRSGTSRSPSPPSSNSRGCPGWRPRCWSACTSPTPAPSPPPTWSSAFASVRRPSRTPSPSSNSRGCSGGADPGGRRERYVLDDEIWLRSTLAAVQMNDVLTAAARRGAEILGAATPAGARFGTSAEFLHVMGSPSGRAWSGGGRSRPPGRRHRSSPRSWPPGAVGAWTRPRERPAGGRSGGARGQAQE